MVPRRVLLLINPQSRSGKDASSQVRAELSRLGLEVVPDHDTSPADFREAVRTHAASVDAVVIAGGDGSVNAALPALLEVDLPVAVIPLGTSNNLARELEIPLELKEACGIIFTGSPKRVDVASVNDLPFLVVAGMGVSIHVNREVKSDLKKRFGMFAYIFTALRVFRTFRAFRAEITTPSRSVCIKTLQISVCNGKHFGSGLTVASDAAIDDGELDLFSVEVKRWWQIPGVVLALRKGTYEKHHPVFHLRAKELTLTTSRPMSVDTDGEITTKTPARFSLRKSALSVFAPVGPALADTPVKL
ncbi:MAG: lipid kinase [Cryobacterium sp.]|nr:lipid kinase [Oligoflexia bacterium]